MPEPRPDPPCVPGGTRAAASGAGGTAKGRGTAGPESQAARPSSTHGRGVDLTGMAVAASLGLFVFYNFVALQRSGFEFHYPLDDVYIHLAMAEQIAQGGYGVNAGELAAAASSPLYPLLLLPFAGTGFHLVLPVLWNGISVTLAGWLWARILIEAGYGAPALRSVGVFLALVGPIAINVAGVGLAGMDNGLHGTVTLAALLGLTRFLATGGVGPWLILGVCLGPALRHDGLAVSLAICGVVALLGRMRPAIWLTAGASGIDWVRPGELVITAPVGHPGHDTVTFYATRPKAAAALTQKLHAFRDTVPAGAEFRFSPGMEDRNG